MCTWLPRRERRSRPLCSLCASVDRSIPGVRHRRDARDTVIQRLLLDGPSSNRARRLVVTHSLYHALTNGHLYLISQAAETADYGAVLAIMQSLAAAYALKHPRKWEDNAIPPRGKQSQEDFRLMPQGANVISVSPLARLLLPAAR